jgi:hypothetical protein
VTNNAAPKSSPTAREPEWLFIAAKVENISEEPFPRASKVATAFQGSGILRAAASAYEKTHQALAHAQNHRDFARIHK